MINKVQLLESFNLMVIEEKIQLLESFKKNQLSTLIDKINIKIFEIIHSERVSPLIAPYFEQATTINTPQNPEESKNPKTPDIPFTNFESEPDNITQIKKLINALHYARLTFIDLENIDIRNISHTVSDLKHLFGKTIESAYNASYLITHLDVNLKDLFQEELSSLYSYLIHIQERAEQGAQVAATNLQSYPIANNIGEIAGITADQLRPLGGNVDYNFLTQFSALLPQYINEFTKKIEEYSSQIKEKEPRLNQQKLDELRYTALHLLNDIEKLQGNHLFMSVKVINYIHIIRNLITLSMSTLEQIGELSDSSQDVICDKLTQIKYDLLPTLFGLVDKIEVHCMLKPGILSTFLMKHVQKLYNALVYLPSKAIDFQTKGEELLCIEDSHFIELRLELAYERIDAANKILHKIKPAQDALKAFFNTLKNPEYENLRINQLPNAVKEQLITHYKIIKPYVTTLDVDFDNQLITSLLGSETWSSYLKRCALRRLAPDNIKLVLTKEKSLSALIEKNEKTQLFHIELNRQLIDSVYENTQLVLYPYNEKTNVYTIDEIIPLNIKLNDPQLIIEKTQFLTLAKDFNRLNRLLKDSMTLASMNDSEKLDLKTLYDKLYPYLIPIISPKQKDNMEKFALYLVAILENKIVDQPQKTQVTQLMQHCSSVLRKIRKSWPENINSYYDLTEQEFLTDEESKIEAKKLKFERTDNNTNVVLKNPEQLTANQAIDLRQWCENRYNKLQIAQKAYEEFHEQLQTHSITENKIHGIRELEEPIKIKCRKLYNIFQPYFVCAIPSERKADVLKIDRFLTASLSNKPVKPEDIPPLDQFETIDVTFRDYCAKIESEWYQTALQYLSLIQKKLTNENEANTLTLTPQTGERADHLLKNTNISEGINEFRTVLFGIHGLFNQVIKEKLIPQKTGVPYPEMEDPYLQLAESMQVRSIKDIYNCLYHIEGIAIELEKLKNHNLYNPDASPEKQGYYATYLKGKYVYTLLQAYSHINEIIKLTQRLSSDPHGNFIARELISKAQNLYAIFQEHSFAYQTTPQQIPISGTVQYNPLWYVLNAAYIAPKHIRSLKNTNYLTTEELNKLHQHAKQATLTIEEIINNSHSYFKLFLQTPKMLFLYRELTQKFNEFTTTTHDAVINNVDKIRPEIFTPLLHEADHWEIKLGLAPGSLSEPLRCITNEFYKGLLHPLDLSSTDHIDLICNDKPLEARMNLLREKTNKLEKNINKVKKDYADLNKLYDYIVQYKKICSLKNHLSPQTLFLTYSQEKLTQIPSLSTTIKPLFATLETPKRYEAAISSYYKKILPILAKLRDEKKIYIEPSTYEDQHMLDKICGKLLNKYDPQFTETESWIKASYHYARGLLATYETKLQTVKKQQTYLENLRKIQDEEHKKFILDYTTEAFDKHLNTLCNSIAGLLHTKNEYRNKLRPILLMHKDEIIEQSQKANDINICIKKSLESRISEFSIAYYEEYYQLDRVQTALYNFSNYINNRKVATHSLLANHQYIEETNPQYKDPLDEKSNKISELQAIAENEQKSPKARFEEIRKKVDNDPNFKRIMLAPNQPINTLSFPYLKACLLSLLEALHLYTPTKKKRYNDIINAVNNPSMEWMKFGLFAQKQDEKPLATGQIEQNDNTGSHINAMPLPSN